MYHPQHGDDELAPKKYGAHAGAKEILDEDYHGHQEHEEPEYLAKDKYNPFDEKDLYQTEKGEKKDKKDDKDSEIEEILKKELPKEEEREKKPAVADHGPIEPPPDGQQDCAPKSMEDIIHGAFKREAQPAEEQRPKEDVIKKAFAKKPKQEAPHEIIHRAFKRKQQ
ncbi:MAG: hypothetical protein V1735_06470 [Nanoarchaeota archaeon]